MRAHPRNELVIIAAWWINPGQDFDELPESYVIFITRDDALGYGLPIYHVDRKIEEVSENFKDEAHIIYVNSKKQERSEEHTSELQSRIRISYAVFCLIIFWES